MVLPPPWLRHLLVTTIIAALAISTSGCYTYHVYQIGGAEGREQGNQPATEWKHKTLHAFAWGLVRQDLAIERVASNPLVREAVLRNSKYRPRMFMHSLPFLP